MIQKPPTTTTPERILPHDQEAEMSVLGSMLLRPDVCDDVSLTLEPSDFFDQAHATLYATMRKIWEKGRNVDPVLLMDQLKKDGVFELVGGSGYIGRVSTCVPNASHAKYYARIVHEKSVLRALIAAGTDTIQEAYFATIEAEDQLSAAEARFLAIRDGRRTVSLENIKDIMDRELQAIDARSKGDSSDRLPTGFYDLDKVLGGGLRSGNMAVLAARPGIGKSALAANIAYNVAKSGKSVLFISLEMTKDEIAERMLSACSKVQSTKMRSGTLSVDDRKSLVEWGGYFASLPLWIEDSTPLRVGDIGAHARRVSRSKQGLALIVIDYLQLIDPDNQKDNRQEQVAKISRRLKGLAKERSCPVLALCQLNRQSESGDGKPRLWHLRESGAIEQDADTVWLLHRTNDAVEADLYVAKQRNGATGKVGLYWDKALMKFENAARPFQEFEQYNEGTF